MSTTGNIVAPVSIAKGGFDQEALTVSPQLTMDSIDSEPDTEFATASPQHSNADDKDRQHGSLPSSHTDQVLELNHRLDLSDSSAIITRLSTLNASPEPPSGLSNRISPSKVSVKSKQQLSMYPQVPESHDAAPLKQAEFLYYLYSFAILGTSIRVFLGRLFGSDCENQGQMEDFLTPLSEQICVTSGGTTLQHGGALFTDLPANMLGSFVMGLVSSLIPEGGRYGSKLPWLRNNHPLQNHQGIHHAIKVGLCGSLTTFSSWNSQMVTMIDGTDTELGPQLVPALFGYMIGMATACWSFIMGGRVHEWLYDCSNRRHMSSDEDEKPPSNPSLHVVDHDEEQPTSWDSEESSPRFSRSASCHDGSMTFKADEVVRSAVPSRKMSFKDKMSVSYSISTWLHKVIPFCIVVSLLLAYGLVADESNIQFYRELFTSSLLTPIGVHLRWKLAALNGRGIGSNHKYEWMPWGTLTGNLCAVVISIVFKALWMQYNHGGSHPYVLALVVGMKTGVAGSLSTVSSFAKETVNLATVYPTHAKAYIYSTGTLTASMLIGLIIYSPMLSGI